MEIAWEYLVNAFSSVSVAFVFIAGLALVFFFFVCALICEIITGKRIVFFSVYDGFCLTVSALQIAALSVDGLDGEDKTAVFFTLGMYFLLKTILKLPIKKKTKTNEVLSGFIRELDEKIHSTREVEKLSCRTESNVEQKVEEEEVDFAHIKNVAERLKYYGLNQSEKKQVNELLSTVREIELGNRSEGKRNAINEGLGTLLKIMSKYRV